MLGAESETEQAETSQNSQSNAQNEPVAPLSANLDPEAGPASPPAATPEESAGDAVRAKEAKSSTFKTRVKLGAGMLVIMLGMLAADHAFQFSYCFMALALMATMLGLLEFYRMASQAGSEPWWFTGTLFGTGVVAVQWWMLEIANFDTVLQVEGGLLAVVIYLLVIMALNVLLPERKTGAQNIAITTFGVLYIGLFMSFFIKIRAMRTNVEGGPAFQSGEAMIWLIFLSAKCTDMGAYFIGRKFGTVKLIPKVSPGKTWEGALGGLASGMIAALVVYYASGLGNMKVMQHFPPTTAAFLGFIIAVAAMSGDLFESLLKRRYEVKDSANLVPAFGGMLDMIDSLLLNGPIVYFFLQFTNILEP